MGGAGRGAGAGLLGWGDSCREEVVKDITTISLSSTVKKSAPLSAPGGGPPPPPPPPGGGPPPPPPPPGSGGLGQGASEDGFQKHHDVIEAYREYNKQVRSGQRKGLRRGQSQRR
jgi:hypothetical protein